MSMVLIFKIKSVHTLIIIHSVFFVSRENIIQIEFLNSVVQGIMQSKYCSIQSCFAIGFVV